MKSLVITVENTVKLLDTSICSITASVAGTQASILINNINSVSEWHYWTMI